MPFTEIELKYIENTVGKMCKRSSPAQLRNQLRTVFEVKGHDVTVYEERPGWDNPKQWSSLPVAKFKYIRKDNAWKLYWMRRDMKWHLYEMPYDTKTLESLIKEVDSDPHGAFFG